ncbi:MAG: NAD(P)-dependent oxidoreductase [Chloroflexi bacterium]|nr:NAD(P)-dependent oxidoreductase [Chloroflexota bacterium]MCL5026620.1 NAD(P)-dependent oxidoreductase [Chloroflexota bacterium]
MPVVVTGIGYIGSELVRLLLAEGEEVIAIDNFFSTNAADTRSLRRQPGVRFIRGDVANPKVLEAALSGPVHTVYSLAAQPSAHPKAASVAYMERSNLVAPRVLLDAMAARDVRRLVFASSLRVCGEDLPALVTEAAPYGPFRDISHLSKCYTEKLMEMYAATSSVSCAAVRLGVTYGVSPVMKDDYRFVTVPNKFCLQALRGEAIRVYPGGHMPIGLIHVADAAAALRAAVAATGSGGFTILNAATEACSVRQIAALVAGAARRRGRQAVVSDESVGGEREVRIASRLGEYGFAARHTLASGVEEMLDYWEAKCESS